jgi:hypothetical protein
LHGLGGALQLHEAEEKKPDAKDRAENTVERFELAVPEPESRESDEPHRGDIQIDGGKKREERGTRIRPRDHRKCALERQQPRRDKSGEQERNRGCALTQCTECDAENGGPQRA